eukprot:CAMPEP_0117041886 /NCGR_PEP_ID=MMETSP0472-20121206/29210_1 /TAXON_ID=693140 ORGANISM="Tiarina fusus, Strain LIS" /NCGR_SAMPLE_ID=MMETSP0472 /ASSEMBLY_ACC=CAM_ASM_000603 /LENGTH=342 /DNA_ID=CAMNT_0004752991 /DNA_START=152 /DNA_END=1176 /DNA_ORIENTATION=-
MNGSTKLFQGASFSILWIWAHLSTGNGFCIAGPGTAFSHASRRKRASRLMIRAPPGSGYATPEDETSELPDSYDPMMEYPGTMRPGRTPENMPFHDLPIADSDPDPVPWPHFQEIEWHHKWAPPHPHPIPMEEFIEQQGRWATPEMEAAMRAGNRRDARRRREMEEEAKRETLIMDDDDDQDEPQDLGDGMFGQLGSAADQAVTAAATAPRDAGTEETEAASEGVEDEDDGGLDDFLLDLGLDSYDDVDNNGSAAASEDVVSRQLSQQKTSGLEDVVIGDDDDDDSPEDEGTGTDVTASIDVDDDDDLDLGLDEEDDAVSTVPLEDFGDGDNLDTDDFFDDG